MMPMMVGCIRPLGWWTPYGAGVTWDPANKGTNIVLSNGNLTATYSSAWTSVRATSAAPAGFSYFEITVTTLGAAAGGLHGACGSTFTFNTYLGQNGNSIGIMPDYSTQAYVAGTCVDDTGNALSQTLNQGDVLGVLIDNTNHRLYMSRNGTWYRSANPRGGTGYCGHGLPSTVYGAVSVQSGRVITANFGASAFSYPPV